MLKWKPFKKFLGCLISLLENFVTLYETSKRFGFCLNSWNASFHCMIFTPRIQMGETIRSVLEEKCSAELLKSYNTWCFLIDSGTPKNSLHTWVGHKSLFAVFKREASYWMFWGKRFSLLRMIGHDNANPKTITRSKPRIFWKLRCHFLYISLSGLTQARPHDRRDTCIICKASSSIFSKICSYFDH